MKKQSNWGIKIFISIFFIGFITLVSQRDKMNCIIANYNLNFNRIELPKSDSLIYVEKFDVSDTEYKLSLVELGGQGCKPCKKMEKELDEVKNNYGSKLNLVMVNVTKDKDKKASTYFKVRLIPTQVILNPKGEELYRHSGYISKEDLELEIDKLMQSQNSL
ncbi:MAG: thioredoxin family protein [Flavobacteriales bacterium]|nr:thioredoxin family protein [Flavobacteriales bacterium]